LSLLVINLSSTLKSNISTLITIYAKSSALINSLTRINLINFVTLLIITSIALHFYPVSSLIESSNLIIKSIITLFYSCLDALCSYSRL
jgi:hypothetical protein